MKYQARVDQNCFDIELEEVGVSLFKVKINGKVKIVDAHRVNPNSFSMLIDNRHYDFDFSSEDDTVHVYLGHNTFPVEVLDEKKLRIKKIRGEMAVEGGQVISTSMPGKVVKVMKKEGDLVKKDEGLVVVEAMKMENELRSSIDGQVVEICVKAGQTVEGGAKLARIEPS